jgi:DNA-binding response OmpR family regulator
VSVPVAPTSGPGVVLGFPDPFPPELAGAVERAGYRCAAIGDARAATTAEPDDGWAAAVVSVVDEPTSGFRLCQALRTREVPLRPLLLVLRLEQLSELHGRDELYDDFAVLPAHPLEVAARLRRLLARSGREPRAQVIEYGPLVIDLETYQAAVAGRPLDLTYMEYQLLRFLAARPGKVFTRETLLSRVWGYEYYGGARTVDVHVRRLRAKLGEEHAHLIETVRSVGYRFGSSAGGA